MNKTNLTKLAKQRLVPNRPHKLQYRRSCNKYLDIYNDGRCAACDIKYENHLQQKMR